MVEEPLKLDKVDYAFDMYLAKIDEYNKAYKRLSKMQTKFLPNASIWAEGREYAAMLVKGRQYNLRKICMHNDCVIDKLKTFGVVPVDSTIKIYRQETIELFMNWWKRKMQKEERLRERQELK